MAAIATAQFPINRIHGWPYILEGTLLALGSDGGGNYSCMELGTLDNQIMPADSVLVETGPAPVGFIQEDSATLAVAGDEVTVYGPGAIVWAVAGAGITKGRPVMSEAAAQTGRVVTATDGHWAIGIAMATAGAEDAYLPVLVQIFVYNTN